MRLIDAVQTALHALGANRLRSGLTTLGMVIGVSSVIVLIAVGQGAQRGVQERIQGLGTNLIFVRPGAAQTSGSTARGASGSAQTLTQADADAIAAANIPGVVGVAPQIAFPGQAIVGNNNAAVTIIGTTAAYSTVRSSPVATGAFITDADVERRALNVALGSDVAKTLFPDGDAVGQSVRVALGDGRIAFNFRIVGTMQPHGGSNGGDQDSYIYLPVTALQNRIGFLRNPTGQVFVTQINVQTSGSVPDAVVSASLTQFMSQRHNTLTPDFLVQSQSDLIGAASEVSRTLSILLGSVAGISLIVGGIGVMNIMLVSVTERTREIGIRRAIGARGTDVLVQFVSEALALTIAGGLLGIAVGVAVATSVNGRQVSGQAMTTVIQAWSIAVAFVVSVGIGLLSGIYPAIRASRLDPILALRNE